MMIKHHWRSLALGLIVALSLGVFLGISPSPSPIPVAEAAPKPTKTTKTTKAKPWKTTTIIPTTSSSTTTSTIPETTTTSSTTTTTEPEPTTTTVGRIVLSGTAPVTDQGLIIYGDEFDGLPIPGGEPDHVILCPGDTSLDFSASSFTLDPGLHVEYFPEFHTVMILADLDVVGNVTYELVCV